MAVERITYVKCDRCKRNSIAFTDCSKKVAINLARKSGFIVGKVIMCPRCSNLYPEEKESLLKKKVSE